MLENVGSSVKQAVLEGETRRDRIGVEEHGGRDHVHAFAHVADLQRDGERNGLANRELNAGLPEAFEVRRSRPRLRTRQR